MFIYDLGNTALYWCKAHTQLISYFGFMYTRNNAYYSSKPQWYFPNVKEGILACMHAGQRCHLLVVEESLKMGMYNLEPMQTFVKRLRFKYRRLLEAKFVSIIIV